MTTPQPSFAVISGAQVDDVLSGDEPAVVDLVRATYLVHEAGRTINPPSYFLRFPERPADRIIALPASIAGSGAGEEDGTAVDGIKWIASVPGNVERGIPRASAVTILNDPVTGYPYACLESSIISAARTAASAALAASVLSEGRPRPTRLGIVGGGLIARYCLRYLLASGQEFDRITIHDLSADHAETFAAHTRGVAPDAEVVVAPEAADLMRASDLVLFATVAAAPHVTDPALVEHAPLILNVSLRDLGTAVVLASRNVVDDVDHVLKASTSVHLTEQETGGRDFIDGTLAQVMNGDVKIPAGQPVVFSPFGLGVLDLALARHVHDRLAAAGELRPVDGFFHELTRVGVPA